MLVNLYYRRRTWCLVAFGIVLLGAVIAAIVVTLGVLGAGAPGAAVVVGEAVDEAEYENVLGAAAVGSSRAGNRRFSHITESSDAGTVSTRVGGVDDAGNVESTTRGEADDGKEVVDEMVSFDETIYRRLTGINFIGLASGKWLTRIEVAPRGATLLETIGLAHKPRIPDVVAMNRGATAATRLAPLPEAEAHGATTRGYLVETTIPDGEYTASYDVEAYEIWVDETGRLVRLRTEVAIEVARGEGTLTVTQIDTLDFWGRGEVSTVIEPADAVSVRSLVTVDDLQIVGEQYIARIERMATFSPGGKYLRVMEFHSPLPWTDSVAFALLDDDQDGFEDDGTVQLTRRADGAKQCVYFYETMDPATAPGVCNQPQE